ncbi:pyrimidine/purine nucleoside phosphorylase [Geomonas propionica]|uniref:Pyrimidine/purine nucleoside phosphorylase n=1 Tax=Geomonas propionica TaxID=2798582 RepID=A0ABS0YQ21_9BACT|nr:pyrimidine/purine nucleoside phosphorylase [Geomonas propionica]MBJ6799973.1 pyrimidine/purine nucleoside phosphorylase [Geomonas propionica]
MSEFNNVTVVKEANVYFDGGVTSRTIFFADGSRKTLGIMMPGEYTFNTGSAELMEIMAGEMTVLLPGSPDWVTIRGGEAFEVPENSSFKLKVSAVSDYCCSFL